MTKKYEHHLLGKHICLTITPFTKGQLVAHHLSQGGRKSDVGREYVHLTEEEPVRQTVERTSYDRC